MPYYKDTENKVHYLDSVDYEHLLPAGSIMISDDEADALQTPPAPTPQQVAIEKIAALEASVTDRRIREAVLGIDGGWLAKVNDQIAAFRKALS